MPLLHSVARHWQLVNCEDCIAAGHGWDEESASCGGGFPLRECGALDISDIDDAVYAAPYLYHLSLKETTLQFETPHPFALV